MTLHERLKVYEDQHAEFAKHFEEVKANLHRLGGAIAAVKDQIEEEVAAKVSEVVTSTHEAASYVAEATEEPITGEYIDPLDKAAHAE